MSDSGAAAIAGAAVLTTPTTIALSGASGFSPRRPAYAAHSSASVSA